MQHVVLIEKLTEVISNKYEAVRVIAKEARRINALLIRGAQGEAEEKPTMMALKRVLDSRVKFDYIEPDQIRPEFGEEEETESS
jgi:DNA-directed RNA polymerase subunit K/omega